MQDLWDALLGFTQKQLMRLLAHCAALAVDAVVRPGAGSSPPLKHAESLSQAVSLDMAAHWQPTAVNYLGQVTKAVIVEAVRQGVSEEAAAQLADLKKPAMAEAAERLLATRAGCSPYCDCRRPLAPQRRWLRRRHDHQTSRSRMRGSGFGVPNFAARDQRAASAYGL
ncbi:hypothetical protein [Bradyrhizobium sp. CSS354]|uniref:hypothetical protein n=1 Tax=Bradyrhizobium sp. CSS354 TaxID=2699172 RepID=UPI0023B0C7CE|nr:hypothetical protein [Bradyrhizobium sp. CSS354]MDE5464912.1 hypothetical protein [Bradyrhizobium sp. CSS354]